MGSGSPSLPLYFPAACHLNAILHCLGWRSISGMHSSRIVDVKESCLVFWKLCHLEGWTGCPFHPERLVFKCLDDTSKL